MIDASLAAAWCFPDEHTAYANEVLRKVGDGVDAVAPELWALEIRNTLLTGVRRKRITREASRTLLQFLDSLEIELFRPNSYDTLLDLAEEFGLTVYDAAYLDLALRISAPIATLDSALKTAAAKRGVPVYA